ncbi:hypothetical protein O6P43_005001 [Quillaja saponaria]|uniref:Uncharacterized protein n=1 Tax=Quillaja saponaria TaxID=32244 RepID=A0AAD7VGV3_QUISA|nr:hypothetical protein O6P43_005001 [Quillaja saponaria]
MKSDIHANISLPSRRMVAFVSLLSGRVPNKYTFQCSMIKLTDVLPVLMNKANTTKYFRRDHKGTITLKNIQRCVKIKSPKRHTVNEISCRENCISPISLRDIHSKHEGPCYLQKMSIFAFSCTILSRGVNTTSLMHYAMIPKIFLKITLCILCTIITP